VIELTDIAYVRSGVADLRKAATFTTEIVGVELAAPAGTAAEAGAARPRADARHHCLALVDGGSGVMASGFSVPDEDARADYCDRRTRSA
jgi:2,3-dihydroxy-p-cumate/2,3-dihydroxybenzoate 3,4-dioxygenase